MEAFGDHLRRWRRERSLSQLGLAALADTSARHLSFLESGRSAPGRQMVLRLAGALGVGPAERDQALEAAGLPPERRRVPLGASDRAAVDAAIATLLDGHDPLPAIVLDADWRLRASNAGGARLLELLAPPPPAVAAPRTGPVAVDAAGDDPNLIDLLVAHVGTGVVLNWPEVARGALARVRAELARRDDRAPALAASAERLAAAAAARAADGAVPGARTRTPAAGGANAARASAVVPLRIDAGTEVLSLISMVAQFGGVEYLDVEVPGVELMFAADETTRRWFEAPATD